MTKSISIIDYGVGNLLSVARGFIHFGGDVKLVANTKDILEAEKLVLPGVGAYPYAFTELCSRGLVEPLKKFVASGRPLLGICLGMQLLFDGSDEFGSNEGLSLIPGWVKRLPVLPHAKLPNIGWAPVLHVKENFCSSATHNHNINPYFYFVHSYHAKPENSEHCVSVSNYEDISFCAVTQRDNVVGCQFHPEKSGNDGLLVLQRFLEWKI